MRSTHRKRLSRGTNRYVKGRNTSGHSNATVVKHVDEGSDGGGGGGGGDDDDDDDDVDDDEDDNDDDDDGDDDDDDDDDDSCGSVSIRHSFIS
jgi:hypothetical protein